MTSHQVKCCELCIRWISTDQEYSKNEGTLRLQCVDSDCPCHHPRETTKERLNAQFFSGIPTEEMGSNQVDEVKLLSFIEQEKQRVKDEVLKNVGMLRQWLNEDHITEPGKMVTNEQILMWLSPEEKEI